MGKLISMGMAAAALALSAPVARAQHANPVLEDADPATIDPNGPRTVMLTLYGENLPPDCCNHPDYTEYWHIFIRNVDANGTPGPWSHCDGHDGCGMDSFNSSQMTLEVDARRWARTAGTKLQMRYYNGLDASNATDPAVNMYHQPLSDWSNVWTWNVTPPPPPAPPKPAKPVVLRARQLAKIVVPPVPAVHPPIEVRAVRPGIVPPAAVQQKPKIVPPPVPNH